MTSWSSYSETFYRSLLEGDHFLRNHKRVDKYMLKNVIDPSCSNIAVYRETPGSSSAPADCEFLVSDSLDDAVKLLENPEIAGAAFSTPRVIHKTAGNHTAGWINRLYASAGNVFNSLHTLAFERSHYSNVNIGQVKAKDQTKRNLTSILSREIVNTVETLTLYDDSGGTGSKQVVIRPAGVLNAGLKALELTAELSGDDLVLSVKDVLTVYPSCFFIPETRRTAHFMEPYAESDVKHKLECSWDGYMIKAKNQADEGTSGTTREALDILEVRADNPSLYSATIYARNTVGIFVGRYHYDGEWRLKTLNNVSFAPEERVCYMAASPFLPGEAAFVTTAGALVVYDAALGHERDKLPLAAQLAEEETVQTCCYGMDNNTLVLGGNRLYALDRRSSELSPLILPTASNILVTSTKWTERKYGLEYLHKKQRRMLAGRACASSMYWSDAKSGLWDSFTACETHPFYRHILAAVCGTGNSILIIDLRVPNAPVLDIPLPSAEFAGARFRSLRWSCSSDETLLFAFSWRQRDPLCVRLEVSSNFTSYSVGKAVSHAPKDFENADLSFDTLVKFDRTRLLNFRRVDPAQEDADFPSAGPLAEGQSAFFALPFHVTQESALTNIFHGFLGFAVASFPRVPARLALALTTSGRLLALELGNRNVVLNAAPVGRAKSEIDLEDRDNCFRGFNIRVANKFGVEFPAGLEPDPDRRFLAVKSAVKGNFKDFVAVNLSDAFVRIQEQHFGGDRSYSNVTLNCSCVPDGEVVAFDSREILERVLAAGGDSSPDDAPILPLDAFEKRFGPELGARKAWNPVDFKLDCEREAEVNNPFVPTPGLCACGALQPGASGSQSVLQKLADRAVRGETLAVGAGLANAFGDALLLQSGLSQEREPERDVVHRDDCPAKALVCVQVGDDRDDAECPEAVEQLISSWVPERSDEASAAPHPDLSTAFEVGDPVEELRALKKRHVDLIRRTLSSTDARFN